MTHPTNSGTDAANLNEQDRTDSERARAELLAMPIEQVVGMVRGTDAAQDSIATSVDLDKLEALAREAMPGPWEVQVDERPHHRGGVHHERRIATSWEHGQLKAKYPVVTTSVGIGKEKDGPPYHMVGIREEDANFIAAANPETVLALIELARRALSQPVAAKGEDPYHLDDDDEVRFPNDTGVAVIHADRYWKLRGCEDICAALDAKPAPASPAQPDTTASASGLSLYAAKRVDGSGYGSWLYTNRERAELNLAGNGPLAPKYEIVELMEAPPAQHVVAVDERQQAHVMPPTRGTGSQHDTSTKVLTDDEMLVIADENDYAEEDPKCIVRLCRAVEDKAIRRFRAQGGNTNDSTPLAWLATDLDGRGDVGFTKEEAKRRAGEGCTEFFPLYDIAPAPAAAHEAGRTVYTCIGKGGRYRLLGLATGAGASRGQPDLRVYMAEDNPLELYYRTVADFDSRMAAAGAAGHEGGDHD
jgi:hypothetical protein